MRTFVKNILCLYTGMLLFSCTPKVSHEKALKYFVSVAVQADSATSIANHFLQITFNRVQIALQRSDRKMDSNEIDTINNYYNATIQALDVSINKIEKIEELDKEINLRNSVLHNLKNVKQILQQSTPTVIKVFTIGLGNATKEQRDAIIGFKNEAAVMQEEQSNFIRLEENFENKYNITDAEINGVTL